MRACGAESGAGVGPGQPAPVAANTQRLGGRPGCRVLAGYPGAWWQWAFR